MIRVAICEDEQKDIAILVDFLQQYFESMERYEVTTYKSGADFLDAFCEPDLLFLDVEMEKVDGIEVKNVLRERHMYPRTLFVSRHPEAMEEAYDKNVYGFLTKPMDYELFVKKMRSAMEDIKEERQTILLVQGENEEKFIHSKDILYVEAQGKYTRLYLSVEESVLFDERGIGKWCDMLDGNMFALSHRSYLVNLDKVEHVKEKVILESEKSVPISRRLRKEFEEKYRKRLIEKARLGG